MITSWSNIKSTFENRIQGLRICISRGQRLSSEATEKNSAEVWESLALYSGNTGSFLWEIISFLIKLPVACNDLLWLNASFLQGTHVSHSIPLSVCKYTLSIRVYILKFQERAFVLTAVSPGQPLISEVSDVLCQYCPVSQCCWKFLPEWFVGRNNFLRVDSVVFSVAVAER